MRSAEQLHLFGQRVSPVALPRDYEPARPAHFEVARICLAKGSITTPERKRFVERICDLYPEARVEEHLDTPHNRLRFGGEDPLVLHQAGKRTLVFGELESAVRFAQEEGNAYRSFTKRLLEAVPIQRLALGGICIYRSARDLMERKMGMGNRVSGCIDRASPKAGDGRARYPRDLRHEAYSLIIETAHSFRPDLEVALCLEEQPLRESTGLMQSIGRCNCGL